jgi:hypothetical protein
MTRPPVALLNLYESDHDSSATNANIRIDELDNVDVRWQATQDEDLVVEDGLVLRLARLQCKVRSVSQSNQDESV